MNLFGRKKNSKNIIITGTVCGICGMEFATTLRMLKHMKKAHTKTKKGYESTCPNC